MRTTNNTNTEKLKTTQQLFKENEIKTNRMVYAVLMLFSCFEVLIAALGILGITDMSAKWCCYAIIVVCTLTACLSTFLLKIIGIGNDKCKVLLLSGTILISGTMYFLYPSYTSFILFGPILLSIKYYDEKFVLKTTLITWSVYVACVTMNVILDFTSKTIAQLHLYEGDESWSNLNLVISSYIIPKTFIFFLEGVISYKIAQAGRKLVITQAEISNKANIMENDLKVASVIQNKALPETTFESKDKSIFVSAYQHPAREVGGDFFDYFMLNDNMMVILVADVSDKGLPAAMFVIEVQSIIRFALSEALINNTDKTIEYINLEETVNSINRQVSIHNMNGMFISMWIGCIDTRSGVGKYINAGHCSPYIRRENGSIVKLESNPQVFLGCFEDFIYKSNPFRLNQSETLVLYTDGVTDARDVNDATFSSDKLEIAIRNSEVPEGTNASRYICNSIKKAVKEHINNEPQYDDMTIMTVSFEGNGILVSEEFELKACDKSTSIIIDNINKMLKQVNCPDYERRNFDVAIDEICSNISIYAYENCNGNIGVKAHAGSNYITASFTDSGKQFNPVVSKDPDIGEPLEGGLGIYLFKNLADSVEYSYNSGKNILTICKVWNI